MNVRQALENRSRGFPDPSLTPETFARRYYACPVVLRDGSIGNVRVHKYRLNRDDPANLDPSTRIRDGVADSERTLAARAIRRWCQQNEGIGREVFNLLFRQRKLNQAYFGKGAPRDIALILNILNEVGRIAERSPSVGEVVALQDYCDTFIGVDCSGFVNNYFIATGHFTDTNQNCQTVIRRYGRTDRRLDFLPDRPRAFILVWKSMGHIAIIDRWQRAHDRLQVVESSASLGGIVSTTYEVDADLPDLSIPPQRRYWRTYRLAQAHSQMDVYMVSPMPPA